MKGFETFLPLGFSPRSDTGKKECPAMKGFETTPHGDELGIQTE